MSRQPASRTRGHVRRTSSGRRVTVRPYRRHLKPRRAVRNLASSYKAARKRRYTRAAVLGTCAVAELGGWVVGRGLGMALTTAGIALLGAGIATTRTTGRARRSSR